ncbi:MAG: transcriptional regulator, TetR family, partial [Acidimicrobiales bacterium]|nr:transcriptional regulator, TetR family [Acidimicrobiales bacterium]
MTDASAALTADGRRLRPERNRLAEVDAILQLLDEGHVDPAAALVAERAGVSVRSVFRYFEDLDSLAMAAVERQIERVGHLYEPPDPDGSLTERVEALLVQRRRLFEAVAPVRRHALRRAHAQPAMRAGLEQSGDVLRHQIGVQFAAELDGLA